MAEGNGIGDIIKGTVDNSFDFDRKMVELFKEIGLNQSEGEAIFGDYVATCEAGQIFEDTYLETKVRSIDKFNTVKDGIVTAIGIGALIISLMFPGSREAAIAAIADGVVSFADGAIRVSQGQETEGIIEMGMSAIAIGGGISEYKSTAAAVEDITGKASAFGIIESEEDAIRYYKFQTEGSQLAMDENMAYGAKKLNEQIALSKVDGDKVLELRRAEQKITENLTKTSYGKSSANFTETNYGKSSGNFTDYITNLEKNIEEFIDGNKSFDEVLDDYANIYAENINSNKPWSWDESIIGGDNLSKKQRTLIKQQAINKGLIPQIEVTKVEGMRYGFPDFESAGCVKEIVYMPEEMWKLSDAEQFKWLDEQIGGNVEGYTWHHTEMPGKMELVPTGIHNITTHNGGRSAGMWADAPR